MILTPVPGSDDLSHLLAVPPIAALAVLARPTASTLLPPLVVIDDGDDQDDDEPTGGDDA